jgi:hypothetical protein
MRSDPNDSSADRLIEVKDDACYGCPSSEFDGVEPGSRVRVTDRQQLVSGAFVGLEPLMLLGVLRA